MLKISEIIILLNLYAVSLPLNKRNKCAQLNLKFLNKFCVFNFIIQLKNDIEIV